MLRCDCFVPWFQDDPDVAAEAKRIEDGGGIDDVVRLEKLRKVGPGTMSFSSESTYWHTLEVEFGFRIYSLLVHISPYYSILFHI